MPPLDPDRVLREEANEIHHRHVRPGAVTYPLLDETVTGKKLAIALHERNSSALCISGGGIRSASFGLGVIEALAVNPRPESTSRQGDKQADEAATSLLSQFDYLSTVSGGGYIGSWFSAWVARAGYERVWSCLVGRRKRPEEEPSEIAWLRTYSNYLTPRLGLFSADTWTAVALYVRNLVLNWLVILSALCLVLLLIKTFAVVTFWLSVWGSSTMAVRVALIIAAAATMIWALSFALRNRPSVDPCTIEPPESAEAGDTAGAKAYAEDPHRNETAHMRPGADEGKFVKQCLIPALVAALSFSLYLMIRGPALNEWGLAKTAFIAMLIGMLIYAVAWIVSWPPARWKPCPDEERGSTYWRRDFIAWFIAGGVYGAMIGAGIHVFAKYELAILLGNVMFDQRTGLFLLSLIYGVPWIITAQLTAEMIFVGLTNWQQYSDADREWFGRSTGWFTVTASIWFAVALLVLIIGDVFLDLIQGSNWAKYGSSLLAVGSGLFSTLLGKSRKSSATDQGDKSGFLIRVAVPVAAVVFLILLVVGVSLLMDYLLFEQGTLLKSSLLGFASPSYLHEDMFWLAVAYVVVLVFAYFSWTRVNINRFSIHALYRNRLIRGFLGASNTKRAPNPFTGFDETDNHPMARLWPPQQGTWRPFHVVNIALNVVNSKRLAWQERKATSFTATPLHCGTAADGLGYRNTCDYGDKKRGGLSLGTALAISGAAASPNMGYHSSPIVSLLLALFNVRLGWWLGNPGPSGDPDFYQSDGPKVAINPFITEMFGLTTDDRHYVYLSDGGHFENLGLYEMIRRRCRCIVVSDAGCDPSYGFEDLGNAVRKIAIDLGVYISFGTLHELKNRSKDRSIIKGAYYAVGVIDYKNAPERTPDPKGSKQTKLQDDELRKRVDNGYILYVKPAFHGTESAGIVAYAAANAAFPHETTGDQFFSESQFESYRTLGFEIMDSALSQAAKNCETIANAEKGAPSTGQLHDLIRALDPSIIEDAEAALTTAPIKTPSDVIKSLDEADLKVLRGVFNPAQRETT